MGMVEAGTALCVPGNHDIKLMRKIRGKDVQITHGLADSLEQLDKETPEFRTQVLEFIDALISHYVLDDGKLVGCPRGDERGDAGARFGESPRFCAVWRDDRRDGRIRTARALQLGGRVSRQGMVVYGHTPVPQADGLNRTINIDTGCVFGGRLTALRYPEKELVSVPRATILRSACQSHLSPVDRRRALAHFASKYTTICWTLTT